MTEEIKLWLSNKELTKEQAIELCFSLVKTKYNQPTEKDLVVIFKYLKEAFGLTKEDAQDDDNYALRWSAHNGHLDVVKYLREEFGLTKEDAQAKGPDGCANYALRYSAQNGHLGVVKYLKEAFALTKEDAQADNNYALRLSVRNGHLDVVKYLKEAFELEKDLTKKFVADDVICDILNHLKSKFDDVN
jgi:hypothetical protein